MSTNRVINAKDCAIRLARTDDLPLLREIFAAARAFMAEHGNATQWGANFPPDELLLAHISRKELYVLESADGKPHAAFALTGEDPTYAHIKNGTWLSSSPYLTIHRVASDGTTRGLRTKKTATNKFLTTKSRRKHTRPPGFFYTVFLYFTTFVSAALSVCPPPL